MVTDIFETNLGYLKVNATIRKSQEVTLIQISIPPYIKDRYTNLTIFQDIIFLNKVAFVMIISKNLTFITVKFIRKRRKEGTGTRNKFTLKSNLILVNFLLF